MGSSAAWRERIFAKSGGMCIYCGGRTVAKTVDHMPPRILFDGKQRPEGLEFAACDPCNRGAGRADLVAALVGRIYPDNPSEMSAEDLDKIFHGIANNFPGLLEELSPPRAQAKIALERLGIGAGDGGILRLSPRVMAQLQIFGARFGLAMHFHTTGQILPDEGGVFVEVYSNLDVFDGRLPAEIFDIFSPSTLVRGRKHVADQFLFDARAAADPPGSLSFASFRRSFAILAATTTRLESAGPNASASQAEPFRPGLLLGAPLTRYSMNAQFRWHRQGIGP